MWRFSLLPELDNINLWEFSSISLSSLLGFLVGGLLYFRADRSPVKLSLPWVQELLTYDFYVEKLYDKTVVWSVYQLSQVTAWIDRYVVDGLVNLVGFATILSSESLKYGTSGQMQNYVLTITIGIGVMGATVAWLFLSF